MWRSRNRIEHSEGVRRDVHGGLLAACPYRTKDALLGESLGGAQMSGTRPAIAIRSTLEEKDVLCHGPGWI